MSKHSFTEGPWTLKDGHGVEVFGGDGEPLMTLDRGAEVLFANARLIAAAPDLLAALEEILDYRGGAESALHDEYVVERARAAVAKATALAPKEK